jgi:TonB family protein
MALRVSDTPVALLAFASLFLLASCAHSPSHPRGSTSNFDGGEAFPGARLSPAVVYSSRLKADLFKVWEPDPPETIADGRLEIIAALDLSRRGELRRVSIRKSSGDRGLDGSVLEAVKEAQPFEAPPVGLVDSASGIAHLEVSFVLDIARLSAAL